MATDAVWGMCLFKNKSEILLRARRLFLTDVLSVGEMGILLRSLRVYRPVWGRTAAAAVVVWLLSVQINV